MSWFTRLALAMALGAGVVGASGCVPDGAIRNVLRFAGGGTTEFNAGGGSVVVGTWTTTFVSQGSVLRHGSKFASTPYHGRGAFNLRFRPSDPALKRRFEQFSKGVRYLSVSFSGDTATGTAIARGVEIVEFSSRRAGETCISYTTRYSHGGASALNSARTLGGTGNGARLIASGRYATTSAGPETSNARVTGTIRLGRARSLPSTCRALKRTFGLH